MKNSNKEIQEGYSWIKVPRYKMDESLSWEERYSQLENHHIEETTFLIDMVRELSQKYEDIRRTTGQDGDRSL